MFWLMGAFSLQAMQLEGSFTSNSMVEKTGAPYVLLLTCPFVSEAFVSNKRPVTFLLAMTDFLSEELLSKHVVVEAELIGIDRSCFFPIPIMQIQEVTPIGHPEDWDEEYPDFMPYLSKIITAGVGLMLWESWLAGNSVFSGRDGFVIETLPDGQEIVRERYLLDR